MRALETLMTRTQTVLGWIYLPVHVLLLPLLLGLYAGVAGKSVTVAAINLIYYGLGVVFLLCVMLRYLRLCFDRMLDDLMRSFLSLVLAAALTYALSYVLRLLFLLLLPGDPVNPNDAAVQEAAGQDYGLTTALAIFIAPLVEEVLFRGVVFGSLWKRSRALAHIVSIAIFALAHIWQSAVYTGDPLTLIYALQYVPAAYALNVCYERSGSIWPCIFFHMGYNGLAVAALNAAARGF